MKISTPNPVENAGQNVGQASSLTLEFGHF